MAILNCLGQVLYLGRAPNRNERQQNEEEAKAVDQEVKDYLFFSTYFTSMSSTNCWLIESGCSNHMMQNKSMFKEWCEITSSMVRVGDDKHIAIKGKCKIAISTFHGTKLITNVLYVSKID